MDSFMKIVKAFVVLLITGAVCGAAVGLAVLAYKYTSGLL